MINSIQTNFQTNGPKDLLPVNTGTPEYPREIVEKIFKAIIYGADLTNRDFDWFACIGKGALVSKFFKEILDEDDRFNRIIIQSLRGSYRYGYKITPQILKKIEAVGNITNLQVLASAPFYYMEDLKEKFEDIFDEKKPLQAGLKILNLSNLEVQRGAYINLPTPVCLNLTHLAFQIHFIPGWTTSLSQFKSLRRLDIEFDYEMCSSDSHPPDAIFERIRTLQNLRELNVNAKRSLGRLNLHENHPEMLTQLTHLGWRGTGLRTNDLARLTQLVAFTTDEAYSFDFSMPNLVFLKGRRLEIPYPQFLPKLRILSTNTLPRNVERLSSLRYLGLFGTGQEHENTLDEKLDRLATCTQLKELNLYGIPVHLGIDPIVHLIDTFRKHNILITSKRNYANSFKVAHVDDLMK